MAPEEANEQGRLAELVADLPIGMLTTFGGNGMRSVPMARQRVEPDAAMWFITARSTRHVADIMVEPRVGLTFSSTDTWVALTGRAELVDDRQRLSELWNTFAEAWLPGGREDPDTTLLKVTLESGEYWDTPSGSVATLLSLIKSQLIGDTYEASHGTVGSTPAPPPSTPGMPPEPRPPGD